MLFEFATWDKITPGVSALGAPLGGSSKADAAQHLAPAVQQVLDRPLQIHAADHTWSTTARALGLRLDADDLAAAAYAVGRQGNPLERLGDQLGALVRSRTVLPTSTTDQTALDASLTSMAKEIEHAPLDAHLALAADGTLQAAGSRDGAAVDIPASREQVAGALAAGAPGVELVTHPVPPAIADAQVQAAYDQLSRLFAADAQPLTVTFGQQTWQLSKADLVKIVTLEPAGRSGQAANVRVDDAALRAWAARLAGEINQSVQNARFAFNGGSLKALRPSKQGRTLDQEATVQAVHAALLSDNRTVGLPVSVVEPSVSSDDPQSLGITELIERGSTSFAGSIPEKKHNIQLAAQRLNGVVVGPGQTFSFNQEVGPTTIDAGFQWGFGITSGDSGPKTVPAVAGGICQVATTLFQPVFWAGYQLEERWWHLYWIPAYTSRGVVGLDVTVDSDAGLDFKWVNPTRDYVLIQADSDDEHVYFGLYGKKPDWKVQVDDALITNRTPPDTRPLAQEEPTLPWGRTLMVESARDGFDAEIVRHVIPSDGSKPRELDLKSTYQPAHTVTLVGSAGKPAAASVDDAIQRVLDAQKPTPTPAAAATPAASVTAGVAATPAANSAAKPATPAPTPAATAPPRPAATARPQATAKPGAGIAPTPTPAH